MLHRLDGIELGGTPTHRRVLPPDRVVVIDGVPCADALQTLVDLAAVVDNDDVWEQALECALRRRLVTVAALRQVVGSGAPCIRRVLDRRPHGAPPTGSLLETLALQLARQVRGLGEPVRQLCVCDEHGDLVAYVDLAWPKLGLFIELDGQQHRGQPIYDARRQTAVTDATGWLCGRFTWYEVVRLRVVTARRLNGLVDQCTRRPAS